MNVFEEFSLYFSPHSANTAFLWLHVNWRGAAVQQETLSKLRFCMDMLFSDADIVIMEPRWSTCSDVCTVLIKIRVLVKC